MSKKKEYTFKQLQTTAPEGVYKEAYTIGETKTRLVVFGAGEDRAVIYVYDGVVKPAWAHAWAWTTFTLTKKTATFSVAIA